MADQRLQYNEYVIGAGHPSLTDTANRLALVEHQTDGTHKVITINLDTTDKAIYIDHDDTGTNPSIDIDRDGNNAGVVYGLQINVANAGAGSACGLYVATGYVGIGSISAAARLRVSGSVTAVGAAGYSIITDSTIVASANSDLLYGVYCAPVYDDNGKSSVVHYGIYANAGTNGVNYIGPMLGIGVLPVYELHTYKNSAGANTMYFEQAGAGDNQITMAYSTSYWSFGLDNSEAGDPWCINNALSLNCGANTAYIALSQDCIRFRTATNTGIVNMEAADNLNKPTLHLSQLDTHNNPYCLEIVNTGTGDDIHAGSGALLSDAGVWTDAPCFADEKEDIEKAPESGWCDKLKALALVTFQRRRDVYGAKIKGQYGTEKKHPNAPRVLGYCLDANGTPSELCARDRQGSIVGISPTGNANFALAVLKEMLARVEALEKKAH